MINLYVIKINTMKRIIKEIKGVPVDQEAEFAGAVKFVTSFIFEGGEILQNEFSVNSKNFLEGVPDDISWMIPEKMELCIFQIFRHIPLGMCSANAFHKDINLVKEDFSLNSLGGLGLLVLWKHYREVIPRFARIFSLSECLESPKKHEISKCCALKQGDDGIWNFSTKPEEFLEGDFILFCKILS